MRNDLQFGDASDAADVISAMSREMTDDDIKGALINALHRIDHLEKRLAKVEATAVRY